jgi:hypothetical protein
MQAALQFVPAWLQVLVSELGDIDFGAELPEFAQPHCHGCDDFVQYFVQRFSVQQMTILLVMEDPVVGFGMRNFLAFFERDFGEDGRSLCRPGSETNPARH